MRISVNETTPELVEDFNFGVTTYINATLLHDKMVEYLKASDEEIEISQLNVELISQIGLFLYHCGLETQNEFERIFDENIFTEFDDLMKVREWLLKIGDMTDKCYMAFNAKLHELAK